MKKILFFAALILVLMLSVFGCAKKQPSLVYIVDGETYHTDVLEGEDDFFGNIGKTPEKSGFLFGGWYFDDGEWEKPLSYTDLNREAQNKEYRVYAKWETVAFEFIEEERAYSVVGLLLGAGSEVVIPETYKDIPVTRIAPEAFRGCDQLKSVVLPDTLKTVGAYAFAECTTLEKIVLPNSVTLVDKGAFSNCITLTEVSFSTVLEEIKAEAFANCARLASVTLPGSIKNVGARAFASTTALTSVSLPRGIASLGAEAFLGSAVTELTYAGEMTAWKNVSQENFAKNSSITGVKCLDGTVSVTQ